MALQPTHNCQCDVGMARMLCTPHICCVPVAAPRCTLATCGRLAACEAAAAAVPPLQHACCAGVSCRQVAGGLLQEALMLWDRGMQPNSNIATRAIGYRQALEFLQVCRHATVWLDGRTQALQPCNRRRCS